MPQHRSLWTAPFICLFLFHYCINSKAEPLDDIQEQFGTGEVLNSITEIVINAHRNKLREARRCSCASHACSNRLDPLQECTSILGSLPSCGNDCTTRKVSFTHTSVTTPHNSDPMNLSDEVVEDCCIYQAIDELLEQYRREIKSWVYFGTAAGVSISWPGVAIPRGPELTGDSEVDELLGGCEQYDPRIRPWYLQSISAPRNLIILIDGSSSMKDTAGTNDKVTKWDLAKDVVHALLTMMRFSDVVAVLPLSEEKLANFSTMDLIEGDQVGRVKLLESLKDVQPKGNKQIQEGLKTAFQLLRRAEHKEIKTLDCQEAILLITDGLIDSTTGDQQEEEESEYMNGILELLETEQRSLKSTNHASVFVSTIGENSDHRLARHIACQNNATWIPVLPGRDILTQMESFVSFFANQVVQNHDQIIWSEFYEDFNGLGTMTTATRPIFQVDQNGNRKGKLVGVAGYDVRLVDLEAQGLVYVEIVGQLAQRIGECKIHSVDQCQLQLIRGRDHSCPVKLPDSRCYRLPQGILYSSREQLEFDKAVDFCLQRGGRLAEITTDQDQEIMSGIAAMTGSWIGMNLTNAMQWSWISGRPVTSEHVIPNHFQQGRNCAALDSSALRNNVEARSCNDVLYFFCEFPLTNSKAIPICKDEVYEAEPARDQTSYQDCFQNLTQYQQNLILQDPKFMELRRRNANPALCPLGLEDDITPVQTQCCQQCFNSSSSSYDNNYDNEVMEEEEEYSLESLSVSSAFLLDVNSLFPRLITVFFCLFDFFFVY